MKQPRRIPPAVRLDCGVANRAVSRPLSRSEFSDRSRRRPSNLTTINEGGNNLRAGYTFNQSVPRIRSSNPFTDRQSKE
jgi:hypothetical protein